MATKLKERASFFSAGEQEMIMNANKEYKTIIMAKSNTASAARARQEAVYVAVYGRISMYVLNKISMTMVQWVEKSVCNCKVASLIPLTKCSFTFPCESL